MGPRLPTCVSKPGSTSTRTLGATERSLDGANAVSTHLIPRQDQFFEQCNVTPMTHPNAYLRTEIAALLSLYASREVCYLPYLFLQSSWAGVGPEGPYPSRCQTCPHTVCWQPRNCCRQLTLSTSGDQTCLCSWAKHDLQPPCPVCWHSATTLTCSCHTYVTTALKVSTELRFLSTVLLSCSVIQVH